MNGLWAVFRNSIKTCQFFTKNYCTDWGVSYCLLVVRNEVSGSRKCDEISADIFDVEKRRFDIFKQRVLNIGIALLL